MRTTRRTRPFLLTVATALAVAITVVAPVASPPAVAGVTSDNPVRPTADEFPIPNPGAIFLGDRWMIFKTGSLLTRGTVTETTNPMTGPYTRVNRSLLGSKKGGKSALPAWMDKPGVWAPSATRRADGKYVLFFSGLKKGSTERCIGTAVSTTTDLRHREHETWLFRAVDKPLVCDTAESGAADVINASGPPDATYSIIDATPTTVITPEGALGTFLTYKTEKKHGANWHTTIRMVQLSSTYPQRDLASPETRSQQLTSRSGDPVIEENPILVQRPDGTYTLFTSQGWYGSNCTSSGPHPYRTYYRNSASLWDWPKKATLLPSPKTETCGSGNAHIVNTTDGGYRIFFNGKWRASWGHPTGSDFKKIPFHLYVGVLKLDGNKWRINRVGKAS